MNTVKLLPPGPSDDTQLVPAGNVMSTIDPTTGIETIEVTAAPDWRKWVIGAGLAVVIAYTLYTLYSDDGP